MAIELLSSDIVTYISMDENYYLDGIELGSQRTIFDGIFMALTWAAKGPSLMAFHGINMAAKCLCYGGL